MHELSLSSAIVATVTKHADGAPVTAVKMRIGTLRQVVPDSLSFYFDLVAQGTVCEGARLESTLVTGRMRCSCKHEWDLDTPSFRCPRCGAGDAKVIAGEEFEVESIIIEEGQERSSRRSRALPDDVASATAKSEAIQEGGATGGKQKSASSSTGA